MIMANTTRAIAALAETIGKDVYIDVAKWHLYLSDAHLDTVLAEKLFPLLESKSLSADEVTKVLQGISVKLGGGKREVPLADLLPMQSQVSLMDLLEEFQRDL
jgi:Protein of unknown function (DUF3181)